MELKIVLITLAYIVGTCVNVSIPPKPLTRSMIDFVNSSPGTTWKAGENFVGRSLEEVEKLCGVIDGPEVNLTTIYHEIGDNEELPESFDSREHWPECPTLKEIRDQGSCGSCWAVSAAAAMSDRICVATNGSQNARLSALDLLSCCYYCGFGCHGGMPLFAWTFYRFSGLVTGGPYGSEHGCRPYTLPPCEHHQNGTREACGSLHKTPSCDKHCTNKYPVNYWKDKHYGSKIYFVSWKQSQIQKEIMTHGPVQATFTVYADFPNYKSGVYHHVTGSSLGKHAVKIIGWGVEKDTPYWLVANSWNTDWGDNGFFKILRGHNECGIDRGMLAGLPKVN